MKLSKGKNSTFSVFLFFQTKINLKFLYVFEKQRGKLERIFLFYTFFCLIFSFFFLLWFFFFLSQKKVKTQRNISKKEKNLQTFVLKEWNFTTKVFSFLSIQKTKESKRDWVFSIYWSDQKTKKMQKRSKQNRNFIKILSKKRYSKSLKESFLLSFFWNI